MGERLSIIRLQPGCVLDWWSHIGGGQDRLAAAYPRARRITVEPAPPGRQSLPWWSPSRWRAPSAPQRVEQVADGQAHLVWSNMSLHTVFNPLESFARWHRALAVDGFLMFSTLGPGTLPQLRALYERSGWGPPMGPLVDMHDLGDMLVEAGFADPVMDQETITLTWSNADSALLELRSLGANAASGRFAGLRTPRWRARWIDALAGLAARGPAGRLELDFEIVYGHAFKPLPRARVAAESRVELADMRAMVKARRARPSR